MLAKKLVWKETCCACPEQYDVMYGSKQVAYVRLRGGYLSMEAPDCGGTLVYEHVFENDTWKGGFDSDEERKKYVDEMSEALIKYYDEKKHAKQAN